MLIFLKTDDRRAKRMKIWDSLSQELHDMQGILCHTPCVQFEGHSVHFAKFYMLRFSKYHSSFHLIPTKLLYEMYSNQGGIQAITFFAICQIQITYGTLKIDFLSYCAISHKPILVSCWQQVKQIVKAHVGPLFFIPDIFLRYSRARYTWRYCR